MRKFVSDWIVHYTCILLALVQYCNGMATGYQSIHVSICFLVKYPHGYKKYGYKHTNVLWLLEYGSFVIGCMMYNVTMFIIKSWNK